jgi:hypothetical protein
MSHALRSCVRFTGAHPTEVSEDGNSIRLRLDGVDLEIPLSRIDAIIQFLATAKRSLDRMSPEARTLIEDEEYKRMTNDMFRVRLDRPQDADVRLVPGSVCPAKLVLALQSRPQLERSLVTQEHGAILEIDMAWEVAGKVYKQIWQQAQNTGLPLPKLDKSQA